MYSGSRYVPVHRGHSHRMNKVICCRPSSEELEEIDQYRIFFRL